MRSLHADLVTAQQAESRTPYVRLAFTSGAEAYTYTTATSPSRILSVQDWEEPYGGGCYVRLRNHDQSLSAVNLRGWKLVIGWGYSTDSGLRYSNNRRLWVLSQKDISVEGELITEYTCVDDWAKLASAGVIAAGKKLSGTMAGSFIQMETASGAGGATGIVWGIGTNFIIVVGVTGTFNAGETVTGGTSGATLTNITVATQAAAGGGAWNKDTTILNILKSITSGILTDVTLDEDDPNGMINTYMPWLPTEIGEKVRGIIRQLLLMTQCGARIEDDDNLHVLYLDTSDTEQYEFDSAHAFFTDVREQGLIMPNTVIFFDNLPSVTGLPYTYTGTANNATSVAKLGAITAIEVNQSIVSDAEATKMATAWVAQKVAEINQGQVIAPLECGLELYDMIKVTDSRANVTVTARVGRIDREINTREGTYSIQLRLGGLIEKAGSIPLPPQDALDSDIKDLPGGTVVRPTFPAWILPYLKAEAILPAVIAINFTAVDHNSISWDAGTITTANKKAYSVDAGTLELANANPYYLYYTLNDASLNNTQTFGDAVGNDKVLVAFAKAATSGHKALIVVGTTGPDLFIDELSAITANMGLLTAGEVRVGTGTIGGSPAFTGWRLFTDAGVGRMAGYNLDNLQWYSDTDGRMYCAGGDVILDEDGILMTGTTLRWQDATDVLGYVSTLTAGRLIIASYSSYNSGVGANLTLQSGKAMTIYAYEGNDGGIALTNDQDQVTPTTNNIKISAYNDLTLYASGDDLYMYAGGSFALDATELSISAASIHPTEAAGMNCGSETYYFNNVECVTLDDTHSPAPDIKEALKALRGIKETIRTLTLEDVDKEHLGSHVKDKVKAAGGQLTMPWKDKSTFPEEILHRPTEKSYQEAEEIYQHQLVLRKKREDMLARMKSHRQEQIELDRYEGNLDTSIAKMEKAISKPVEHAQPVTTVSVFDQIWLILKAVQELADKVDDIEKRIGGN